MAGVPCFWTWGIRARVETLLRGKNRRLISEIEGKIAEHSKCVAPLSSQEINLEIRLIRAAGRATASFATATTGACGHIIVNDGIWTKFDHQHKIVRIPDCPMPFTAINNNVGNLSVLQSFCSNCRLDRESTGKLGISGEEEGYLRNLVRVPMGGQRGGPHRLVNRKTPPPKETSRTCVWKDHFGMT